MAEYKESHKKTLSALVGNVAQLGQSDVGIVGINAFNQGLQSRTQQRQQ